MKRIVPIAALLFCAQGALATKPMPSLGEGNPVASSAYVKQNTHAALTAQEAEFWQDKAEYEAIEKKLWPICTENATDMAPACSSLPAEQLKASYPDQSIDGLGARYSVSKEEADTLRQRKTALEKKWIAKP